MKPSTGAMVTANHALAAQAGVQTLARGGNAIDAAVTTSLALGVVEPASSGLGGRGYLVVHFGQTGASLAIDGNSRAPLAARPDMFEVADGLARESLGWGPLVAVVNDASAVGHRAVATLGLAGVLATAHARFGTLPLGTIIAPALALAEDGFEVSLSLSDLVAKHRDKLARFPATARIFLKGDLPPRAGDRLVQADLARTYRAIASSGFEELATGESARAIAAEMRAGGGSLDSDDLADWQPRIWDRPLMGSYRDHRLLLIPEASGGTTLLQIMRLLEGYDLAQSAPARAAHLLLEASRVAFRDRLSYVDDPEFTEVPFAGLASKEFADDRRAHISVQRVMDQVPAADPWAFEGVSLQARGRPPEGRMPAGSHTSHFCVVDFEGTVVSMTQSIIDIFGSGVVAPGTGLLLNSAMHNFDPVPGRLRSIAPRKRSAHFGCPTIVVDGEGRAELAIGGGGGTKIVTGIAQILVDVLDHGRAIQPAVEAPRVHNEGSRTQVEGTILSATHRELRSLGHDVDVVSSRFGEPAFARINAIAVGHSGELTSGIDPFGDAGAAALD